VISSIRRIPEIVAKSGDSVYDQSYLFSTIGFTLLLAALSVWLILGGLKSKAKGRDSDSKPTECQTRPAADGRDGGDQGK
jgi:hypothetical protein